MTDAWYRNCAICWDPIHQCNGFVVGNPLVEPETCRELCGLCAILFMPEVRETVTFQPRLLSPEGFAEFLREPDVIRDIKTLIAKGRS